MFLTAVYTFFRHEWYCETGVYSIFALCEYLVVFSNIAFHYTAKYDFSDQQVLLAGEESGDHPKEMVLSLHPVWFRSGTLLWCPVKWSLWSASKNKAFVLWRGWEESNICDQKNIMKYHFYNECFSVMIFLKSKRKNGISEIVSEQIFHI